MEEAPWSLHSVRVQPPRRVAVIFLTWSNLTNPVSSALDRTRREFGQAMENLGVAVAPYHERRPDVKREILFKEWDSSVREKIRDARYPFLLIVKEDFTNFKPSEHAYGLIWFGPNDSEHDIWTVLDTIAARGCYVLWRGAGLMGMDVPDPASQALSV